MFKNVKSKIAKVALAVLTLQLAFMGLGTGATQASAISDPVLPAPVVTLDKSDLYQDESVNLKIKLTTPGNYASLFLTIDGTHYDLLGSYQDGSADDLDGTADGVFTQRFDYAMLTPLLTTGGHVYETTLPLLADSDLSGLNFGEFSVDVKLGFRAPVVTLNPAVIYQNENTKLTAKLTTPGNWATFYATTDGTNYTFVGSYVDGGADDQDGLTNGSFVANLDYSDFPTVPANYTTHVYETSGQMLASDSLVFLSFGVGSLSVKQDLVAPTFTFSVVPAKVTDVTKAVTLNVKSDKLLATTATGYDITIETVQGTDAPVAQTVNPSADGVNFTSTIAGLKAGDDQLIKVFVSATDAHGNTKTAVYTVADFSFTVDTVAPAAVTGITTIVDASGHVTISWTNPPAGTYTKLRIVRVGDFTVTLDPTATSYTDLTTEQGKTYQYVIVVGDGAGNETTTPQVTVAVPAAVVAAAVSDTTSYVAPSTTTEEVKAADEDTTETPATTEENGFPAWGIIILVLLAAVGAYLIWSQKPEEVVAPAPKPKKNSTPKKK